MPSYEYECPHGHRFEEFFKTFSEAKPFEDFYPLCPVCTEEECVLALVTVSKRVVSAPLGFGLYGNPDGYYKPSPTKRFNTKTVSQLQGNKNAVG